MSAQVSSFENGRKILLVQDEQHYQNLNEIMIEIMKPRPEREAGKKVSREISTCKCIMTINDDNKYLLLPVTAIRQQWLNLLHGLYKRVFPNHKVEDPMFITDKIQSILF